MLRFGSYSLQSTNASARLVQIVVQHAADINALGSFRNDVRLSGQIAIVLEPG
jgi:hypothetical protein